MKLMMQLTVLFAALLLLTGVAFAVNGNCYCYQFTATLLDLPMDPQMDYSFMCFYDDTGNWDEVMDLSLFFDTRDRALAWNGEGCVGSIEFHGGLNGVTAIFYCDEPGRMEIRGHRVDEEYCEDSE